MWYYFVFECLSADMDSSQLEEDNAGIADEAHEVAPRFHRSRDPAAAAAAGGTAAGDTEGECDDEDEEGGTGRGTWGDGWSARKGSALALDHLASVYREEILPFVLPLIEQGLQQQTQQQTQQQETQQQQQQQEDAWLRQEAAVLTLGAVAQGCQQSLSPHLRNVMIFLLQLCMHPKVSCPLLLPVSCCLSPIICFCFYLLLLLLLLCLPLAAVAAVCLLCCCCCCMSPLLLLLLYVSSAFAA